ncbi:MAG: Gfo/Idh/MocA family protein [Candidatus Helarchaeota archaeon]
MDKIGVGIIGAGAIGYVHIQGYQSSGQADVLGIVTRTEEHAKSTAEKFGIPSWYTDYHELLQRDDIKAVSVCTPNYLHAQIVIDAAKAGKHILCEKPLTTSLEEAERMVTIAKQEKVFLMNPSHQRFIPVLENVKAILDELGQITFVRYRFAHQGPYKSWSAMSKEKWFYDPEKAGGGVLLDLGPHALDLLDWFLGDVQVVQSAILKTFALPTKNEDTAVVLLQYKNGTIVELDTSWASNPEFNEFQIYGTNGTIKVDMWERTPIEFMPRKLKRNKKIKERSFEGLFNQVSVSQRKMIHYFVDRIQKNKEPEMTGELGKKILRIILACYDSARTQAPIVL